MEEEQPNSASILLDTLYNHLGIGPLFVSQLVNGIIRDDIIKALLQAGVLKSDQFLATLDKAETAANDLCDRVAEKQPGKETQEILEKMRDAAKAIIDNMREQVTGSTSQ